MCAALTKPRLIAGIMKASPMSQTSALEGFHSVLNQFAPKMISYSFPGMFCRHILAVTHFNRNLDRDNQEVNGVPQVKVHYPKFKNGEAVVRNVKVAQDFGYVEDIYQVLCSALIDEETLEKAKGDLLRMAPLPMNSTLDKQSKSEAISKKARRQSMPAVHFPQLSQVLQKGITCFELISILFLELTHFIV
ncbi:uncharacterized protein LOC124455428 [Xenia sp. Carnegie-2017]|uniref:uncharacterized protein LOC124455428 n=1 Tax=Xenia sp. Carnegie-2017 TaxID=2897299 RepID=UPI001F04D13A|nr:uncharacterized protein LOC124455428 [Xenia sp. Carnegie-2017]XP_046862029.1 uncharacterized protein LOC124455428 [Xenia sp. Carnegie-2017]